MVEDLFLSRERMSDNFKELETQKEVLINLLIRLIQYHKVCSYCKLILFFLHLLVFVQISKFTYKKNFIIVIIFAGLPFDNCCITSSAV